MQVVDCRDRDAHGAARRNARARSEQERERDERQSQEAWAHGLHCYNFALSSLELPP